MVRIQKQTKKKKNMRSLGFAGLEPSYYVAGTTNRWTSLPTAASTDVLTEDSKG